MPNEILKPPLTKIIATLGPASSDPATVEKLIEAGVGIFRINFSHGKEDDHRMRVETVRSVAAELGRPIGILGDLPGPKIRLGPVVEGGIDLEPGDVVTFVRDIAAGSKPCRKPNVTLGCTYESLIDDARPGQRVLINDGAVRMLVVEHHPDRLVCSVTIGGRITTGKGVNLPDTELSIPALTDNDRRWARWACEHDLDFVALSFVRTAQDVEGLREYMAGCGEENHRVPIVAKIEVPKALDNIEPIINAADAIMVARGDLGVEMDMARVPVIQKRLLATADLYGKPCIVATQMLESMIESPVPTRAEASDVAGAIFDGADAVMLSGETAVGKYPVLAVDHMRRIAEQTEGYVALQPAVASAPQKLVESKYRTAALAHGVWTIAQDWGAQFVVAWSQQGGGARYLSQNRFNIPIIAATSDDRVARRMQLLRGVTPVRMPTPEGLGHFTRMIDAYVVETGWAREGWKCILMAGGPIGTAGVTNALALHVVGDPEGGFASQGR